jgi:hypothetical protein
MIVNKNCGSAKSALSELSSGLRYETRSSADHLVSKGEAPWKIPSQISETSGLIIFMPPMPSCLLSK